ncbi:carboxypeptidase-like regulatory domain-containing protein [Sphingomonas sp. RB1R13]|uniref:carboxypeptidase-like regulatory domain-containing protein n=1 Tax=Sphingomonas sp. RB1R13 TaxID=3096159 RepID=UPI002FC69D1C
MRLAKSLVRGLIAALTLPALAAGSVATGAASSPVGPAWTADPDDQFVLEVNIRQLRLGDGVRAYGTPEGTCVLLGDFLTTLDVPMKIDVGAKHASGWAFKEGNRIDVDLGTGRARYGSAKDAKSEMLDSGTVRQTPDGWCVETAALARWFGIGVKPSLAGSMLMLSSEVKLPVELAKERHDRAARLIHASVSLGELPQVRLPYRLWRAPALDFVVSGGATYSAKTGARFDRHAAILAAGEIASMSYEAQASTDARGRPESLRFRAYKSDPDGYLLGPLRATHFGVGDVAGLDSRLVGAGRVGRGAVVTNRPLFTPTAFDRTHLEGDLPAGWEAELYRNGELLAFSPTSSDQRYHFDDVQLRYGENQLEVRLYGPQGQMRTRSETVNVADAAAPPGTTWYWAGVNQPARDLIQLHARPPDSGVVPKLQASVALEHGLDKRTSIGLAATMQMIDDERLTFFEGTVRRTIGGALLEVAGSRDNHGGMAARTSLLAKIGGVDISGEALAAHNFRVNGVTERSLRQAQLSLSAPLRLGRTILPASASFRVVDRNGARSLEAAGRLSASIGRFNLGSDVRWRHDRSATGGSDRVEATLIGSGHIGRIRLRGSTLFELKPSARLSAADLSAYWSASEKADFEGGIGYDNLAHRARARLSYIRRLNTMALALTAEGASDGAVAFGFNLNFSLDPTRGFRPSRLPMASAGMIRAHVYRDLNDNGIKDLGEPDEPGALITTGRRVALQPTDKRGSATVAGLTSYQPIAVGIDPTSLSDPNLAPRKALQVVIPRAGIAADVDIGLVGSGSIEGMLVKDGGGGWEGVELELMAADGKLASTSQSDFDGYFVFDHIPYGHYNVRIAASSAKVIHVAVALGATATVSGDRPTVRLGALRPLPAVEVASNSSATSHASP